MGWDTAGLKNPGLRTTAHLDNRKEHFWIISREKGDYKNYVPVWIHFLPLLSVWLDTDNACVVSIYSIFKMAAPGQILLFRCEVLGLPIFSSQTFPENCENCLIPTYWAGLTPKLYRLEKIILPLLGIEPGLPTWWVSMLITMTLWVT